MVEEKELPFKILSGPEKPGSKFPPAVAFEIAKPQLITNKGVSGKLKGTIGSTISKKFSRSRKTPANMMSSGLSVMGLPIQSDQQNTNAV